MLTLLPVSHASNDAIWLIEIKGAIGPASADHIVRGLKKAQQSQASMVILEIDTPGGLDSAMRQMNKAILASKIPVVGYVSPSGARAASAGTYILYACHIAAMAPATNLGAATPVQIGAPTLPAIPKEKNAKREDSEQPGAKSFDAIPRTAMERKIVNDAVAYIEGLAQLRGRNAQWAKQAVLEGASLPAETALAHEVINFIADDIDQLLAQLDGYVLIISDNEVTLDTEDIKVYTHPVDWRSEFLSVITDPNVAYMLLLLGVYGLIIEFSNPGLGVPGVIGAVAILIALYAFQVLPVSYAGLGLLLLGISLMTAEAFAPSFGILGLGGIVAFVIGSIILMDTELPGYKIAIPLIAAFTTFSVAILVFALRMLVKTRRQIVTTGLQHLVGTLAKIESIRNDDAFVRLEGELWQVKCSQDLRANDNVTITAAGGVVLHVKKQQGE